MYKKDLEILIGSGLQLTPVRDLSQQLVKGFVLGTIKHNDKD